LAQTGQKQTSKTLVSQTLRSLVLLVCEAFFVSTLAESTMPQVCSVCKSPDKAAVESAILRRVPLSRIAAQTKLSVFAMQRHKGHMAKNIVRAAPYEAGEALQAVSLLERVQGLIAEIREIAEKAKKDKSWNCALAALRELRSCLELLGKLSGELQAQAPGPKVSVGVIVNAQQQQPENEDGGDLDLTLARYVCEATNNFDVTEIERMKALCSRVFIESTPHAGIGPPQLIESTARNRAAVNDL
jgi:hypothetical protein